jgi:hypothetical protein
MKPKKEGKDIIRQIIEDLKGTEIEKDFRAFYCFIINNIRSEVHGIRRD